MRVLVTGASGFLGSHIAEQLAEAGHSVVALVRKSSNTKFLSSLPGLELAQIPDGTAQRCGHAVERARELGELVAAGLGQLGL